MFSRDTFQSGNGPETNQSSGAVGSTGSISVEGEQCISSSKLPLLQLSATISTGVPTQCILPTLSVLSTDATRAAAATTTINRCRCRTAGYNGTLYFLQWSDCVVLHCILVLRSSLRVHSFLHCRYFIMLLESSHVSHRM